MPRPTAPTTICAQTRPSWRWVSRINPAEISFRRIRRANIRQSGEFVVNVVTEDLLDAMNVCATDFPAEINELEMAGLETSPSAMVKVPRIRQAHAALECVEHTTLEIGRSRIILGRVGGGLC